MIRVKIQFVDLSVRVFWADEEGDIIGDGWMIRWEDTEKRTVIALPMRSILVIEEEME
jgi:hypothetical protein